MNCLEGNVLDMQGGQKKSYLGLWKVKANCKMRPSMYGIYWGRWRGCFHWTRELVQEKERNLDEQVS